MNSKVLLGMSGGVDNSVSAILKKRGYNITGITFLFSEYTAKE
jgi:tRNA U34 2-thiouridine synthase MnmA/TrmU